MASNPPDLSSLSNPLVTPDQLSSTSSQLDGVPPDLEASLRFAGAQLTQAAGILLQLPQELIAQAIVIFYRFYTGPEGGSFRINAVKVPPPHSPTTPRRNQSDNNIGCLCGNPLPNSQTLLPPSNRPLSSQRLRLPHLPHLSPPHFHPTHRTRPRILLPPRKRLPLPEIHPLQTRSNNSTHYRIHNPSHNTSPSLLNLPPNPLCTTLPTNREIQSLSKKDTRESEYSAAESAASVFDAPAFGFGCRGDVSGG